MKAKLLAAAALVSLEIPVFAHRLDEYLQATLISVEKNQIEAQIRLIPGVAVFPVVLAGIDTDRDGVISKPEQQAYSQQVLRDLSLTVDGDRVRPRLVSMTFPGVEDMKEGLGEIEIRFNAALPVHGTHRRLILENHHQGHIAAYLVNCLVPRDPDIRILAQNRNYVQSFYELDYTQAGARVGVPSFAWWSGRGGLLGLVALLLFTRLSVLICAQRLTFGPISRPRS